MFWSSFIRRWWKPTAAAAGAALLQAACARSGAGESAPLKTVADWFAIKVGDRTVQMQLAIYEPEMEYGLMQRRELQPDQGMLFVYRTPTTMNFWMRNTPLPLDIGFFGRDGVLQEIYPMYPFDETPVRSRSAALQFALEMNQGWFRANGIKPGARLDLAAVRAALQARGAAPADFGLP
jgi:uncharacterized membrane protein (UPF0127 family)